MNDFDDYHNHTGRAVPPGWAICAGVAASVLFWVCVLAWWVL